jgi:hypothetical protein
VNQDADSDVEPDPKDEQVISNAVNATQVQLNPQQVEEAKQITYGKLRQFRRDRLYHSDRERIVYLNEYLKKIRVTDDQNVYNVGSYAGYGGASPARQNTK